MKDATDEDLMREYQQGNEDAFKLLYARYAPRIFGYLSKRLQNREEVHDLFQQALLKLHKSRGTYKVDAPFAPWIFTICRTVVADHYRSLSLIAPAASIQEQFIGDVETSRENPDIHLEILSGRERQAVESRYLKDKSFSEIAQELSISESNSRKIISRALQKLKVGSKR